MGVHPWPIVSKEESCVVAVLIRTFSFRLGIRAGEAVVPGRLNADPTRKWPANDESSIRPRKHLTERLEAAVGPA
jgi:hypothetical protein